MLGNLLSGVALAALTAAQPVALPGAQSLDSSQHIRYESVTTGSTYDILVGLPSGYAEDETVSFPALYILDGGALYPLLRGYQRYLEAGGESPPLLLVAVSYGTDDWQQGNNRSHDYTAPAADRDFWGGAADFRRFLAAELIPDIETRYRADPERRILFGQSLGGQFVLFAAQTQPDLFWGHIASNPALHRNLPFFLQRHAPAKPVGSRLFVASGSEDDAEFLVPRRRWIERWSADENRPWDLEVRPLEGHSHFSAPPAALRQGLLWLFGLPGAGN